ncbi:uncharacterized protein SCODWIG_03539 [Saccharomycodes ludwigii]|uniref:Uncharacterized protein n=1 Tax=Saccharomycodes ludwigii TaxID=36035 RepID=A0A376BAQ3_9ASCO|nr:uncharacterized protein SCODWIG_03539 [Saccharomycodes ludwigii]
MEAVKNTGASLESIELGLNKKGQRKPADKEVNDLCKEDNVMSVGEHKHLLSRESHDILDGGNNDIVSEKNDKKKQQHFSTSKNEKAKTHFTNKLDNTMPEPILSPESTQAGKKIPRGIQINQNRNTTTPTIDKTQVQLLNKSPSPSILDYKSQKCFVQLPKITNQTSPIDNNEKSYTNTDPNNHTPGLIGHKNLTAKNKGENKSGNTIIGNIAPTPDKMQWKYTLKDNMGYSLSNGVISSSELVNELIMEAKKNNLKISIHQHIHNHYGNHGNNTGTTDILFQSNETSPESINAGSTNNSINFMKNNTHANHEANLITGASPLASLDPLDGNNGFTSLTTTQFPQPTFPVSRPPSSLGGAPNTPKIMQDLQEMGISRHRHFKTLPPTVKPKLGSSDSSKLTDINRILNSNMSSSRCRRKNERKRRVSDNTKLGSESEGNTPVSSISSTNSAVNISLNTNIQGSFPEKRCKIHRIKNESKNISHRESRGSSSSHNLEEEEGPDFWESLRSLQPGPALNKDTENEDDSRLELFYQFFGPPETSTIYYSSAALNKKNMKVTEQTEDSEKGLDEDYLLPFNPS